MLCILAFVKDNHPLTIDDILWLNIKSSFIKSAGAYHVQRPDKHQRSQENS